MDQTKQKIGSFNENVQVQMLQLLCQLAGQSKNSFRIYPTTNIASTLWKSLAPIYAPISLRNFGVHTTSIYTDYK